MYFHHHTLWFMLRLRYFSTFSTFLTHWSSSAHLSTPFSFDFTLCLFVFALLYFLHLHFPDQYINTFLLTCYFYLMLLHLQTRDNVINKLHLFFSYSWWLILFLSTQAGPDSFRLSPSTLEKFPFSFYYYSLLLHREKRYLRGSSRCFPCCLIQRFERCVSFKKFCFRKESVQLLSLGILQFNEAVLHPALGYGPRESKKIQNVVFVFRVVYWVAD